MRRDLRLALQYIKRKRPDTAGVDGLSARLAAKREPHRWLAEIRAEIELGEYRHDELLVRRIPKKNGKTRTIYIQTLRDRVVGRAVSRVLSNILDDSFSGRSYAYRPHRSRRQAIERLRGLTKTKPMIFKTDIENCFGDIDRERLVEMIREIPITQNLCNILCDYVRSGPGERGIIQGGALSPILSNVYLDTVDKALERAGWEHVRYADDLAICCRDFGEAQEAEAFLREALAKIGLSMSEDKTKAIDCSRKACRFVGWDLRAGKLHIPKQARKRGKALESASHRMPTKKNKARLAAWLGAYRP